MEESNPKRRRTSPRFDSRRDYDDDNNGSTTPRDPPPPPPPPPPSLIPRPSFASPTRSSLARTNPDILRRRSQSPLKISDPQSRQDDTREGSASQNQSQESQRSLERRPARPKSGLFVPVTSESPLGSPPRRIPGPRPSGALASRPRRSSGKPIPRPVNEPGPEDQDFNPFAGRVLNRTPPPGGIRPRAPSSKPRLAEEPQPEEDVEPEEDAEPEKDAEPEEEFLPEEELEIEEEPRQTEEPPPEEVFQPAEKRRLPPQDSPSDPVVTKPLRGAHATHSKSTQRATSPPKSSPLKQPPLRRPEFSQKVKEPSKKTLAPTARQNSPSRTARKVSVPKGPDGTHEARNITTPDPNAELQEIRDGLQAEVDKLEADLMFATEQNERIRRTQSLRSGTELSLSASRRGRLFDLLRRHLLQPEKETQQDSADEWFDLAMNPTSWLSLESLGQAQPLTSRLQEEDFPLPVSHHPIQMSAAEELPFLQAFTPFEVSGTTSMLQREYEEDPLLRKHSMVIRSANPAGLFMAKVDMVVDTKDLTIKELSVPRLDPAAVAEVGPFVQKVVRGGTNSHMDRNVSIVTWAMAEWYRVAVERAKVWHVLDNELKDKEKLVQNVAKIRSRRKKRKRKEDDDPQSQETDSDRNHAENFTRSALLPHIGRTTYEIPIPDATDEEISCLRIQWRIDFDWTGEAQSKVGLMIGMPGRWRQGDERGSLAAASKVFENLVQGSEGPMTAVWTVVALLAGDVSS